MLPAGHNLEVNTVTLQNQNGYGRYAMPDGRFGHPTAQMLLGGQSAKRDTQGSRLKTQDHPVMIPWPTRNPGVKIDKSNLGITCEAIFDAHEEATYDLKMSKTDRSHNVGGSGGPTSCSLLDSISVLDSDSGDGVPIR